MPQLQFSADNGVNTPKRILDTGGKRADVLLQVLDASTLFFDNARDTMLTAGKAGGPQGFQLKTAQGIALVKWRGEMWGISDTNGGLINYQVFPLDDDHSECGCKG